jgi:hypothetical protein
MAINHDTKGDTPMSDNPEFITLPCTPTQFGDFYGYDAKSVRARMRKITDRDAQPGSGGRWNIDSVEFHDALLADMRRPHNRAVVSAQLKSS